MSKHLTPAWQDSSRISGFHAHVYFTRETRDSALALHARLTAHGRGLTVHSVAEGPRGPHVMPMFGVDIPLAVFAEVLSFLCLNRGPHSILVHPVSGHELLDHSHHALWLGLPQPLDLGVLL